MIICLKTKLQYGKVLECLFEFCVCVLHRGLLAHLDQQALQDPGEILVNWWVQLRTWTRWLNVQWVILTSVSLDRQSCGCDCKPQFETCPWDRNVPVHWTEPAGLLGRMLTHTCLTQFPYFVCVIAWLSDSSQWNTHTHWQMLCRFPLVDGLYCFAF